MFFFVSHHVHLSARAWFRVKSVLALVVLLVLLVTSIKYFSLVTVTVLVVGLYLVSKLLRKT